LKEGKGGGRGKFLDLRSARGMGSSSGRIRSLGFLERGGVKGLQLKLVVDKGNDISSPHLHYANMD